jgi:hypothetical protein
MGRPTRKHPDEGRFITSPFATKAVVEATDVSGMESLMLELLMTQLLLLHAQNNYANELHITDTESIGPVIQGRN